MLNLNKQNMSILDSFLHGLFFSFGFFIVLFFFIIYLVKKFGKKGKKTSYNSEELLPAFKSYLITIKEKEKYEEIKDVEEIIINLSKGLIPDSLNNYEIKKDNSLLIRENEGQGSEIAFVNKYKIIGIKTK